MKSGLFLEKKVQSLQGMSSVNSNHSVHDMKKFIIESKCLDVSMWSNLGISHADTRGPFHISFLELVERYNQDVRAFNEENGLISDCAIEPAPSAIVCEDGRAVLVY